MMNGTTENNHSGTKVRNLQSGQAIVLMALVAVFLLAALGLAVDGGGLYFLWRDAQNASDAAVMAATYARCTNGDTASEISAGLQAAAQNGFNNGGSTKVDVHTPTVGIGAGNENYIQVDITAIKPSYFIQIVHKDPLQVTTHAVGFCSPPFDPTKVPGLWAGSHTCPNTVDWSGSTAYIEGGLFSNNQIQITGSGEVVVGPAEAHTSIDTSKSGKVDWDPNNPPQTGVPYQDDPLHLDLSLYKPTGAVALNVTLYHALIDPVTTPDVDFKVHQGSNLWSPDKRTLEGLYYVNGDVDIGTGVDFGPQGITIVAEGTINWAGKSNTHYYYEVMKETPSGVKYPGIMLATPYVAPNCGDWGIKIPGPSTTIEGVLYAPKAGIDVSGASMTIKGSILGDTINFSGASGKLIYESSLLPPRPPSVQVAE